MKTIAIKLPDSLLAAIENAARKRGENRSALIRQALETFLSHKAYFRESSFMKPLKNKV